MSKAISRRRFMQLAGAGALTAGSYYGITECWPRPYRGINQSAPKPTANSGLNILMIVVDQERAWHTLPADLSIPARARFADSATVFDNYYVNTALCSPSRSVIYSGQHIQHTRVADNTNVPVVGAPLSTQVPTLGTMLQELGYHTAYRGKWHLSDIHAQAAAGKRDILAPYGFADFDSDPGFGETLAGFVHDERIAKDTANWLQTTAKTGDRPWFMACNFVNPHDIMFFDATGNQHADRVNNNFLGPVEPAPNTPLYNQDLGYGLPRALRQINPDSRPATHTDYQRFNTLFYGQLPFEQEDAWARYQNYYYNCIRDVDRHINTVLSALEASGQADRTIVVLTSDHGEMGGVHGYRSKGPFIYRENLNVPLAIHHPDVTQGGHSKALAGAVDLAPTLLTLAGATEASVQARYPGLKGYSLADSLGRSQPGKRDQAAGGILVNYSVSYHIDATFAEKVMRLPAQESALDKMQLLLQQPFYADLNLRGSMRGIIGQRYKFARYFAPTQHHTPKDWQSLTALNDIELYDTLTDPGELHNLAAEPEKHRELILAQNAKLNSLLQTEVGVDDGSYRPGPEHVWRL